MGGILLEHAGDLPGVERSQLGRRPRAAATPRVIGEPPGDRVGGRLALLDAQRGEPARAEVDRVKDQHVARDLLGGRFEEVQLVVEAGDTARLHARGRVDAHPARGLGDRGAVAPHLLAQVVFGHRRRVRPHCARTRPCARSSPRALRSCSSALAQAGCGGEQAAGRLVPRTRHQPTTCPSLRRSDPPR